MSIPAPTGTPAAPAAPEAPAVEATPSAPAATEFKAPTSQDELDRIIEGRLARERKQYDGHDDFKAKAAKWDEFEASKKTPDQKATDEAIAQAETAVVARFHGRLVESEVKSIATSLGFNDPADALTVIDRDQLPIKDDEPDTEAIKKLVEKLATEKPYLVTTGRRGPSPKQQTKQGEPVPGSSEAGKGRAAAALRQLGQSRGRG